MKRNTRRGAAALCLLLSGLLLLGALPFRADATAADDQEFELLGELASRYEGGDAGAIVNNAGDIGGKSYGAYQFASAYGAPLSFALWCQKSENEYYRQIGQTLEAAYATIVGTTTVIHSRRDEKTDPPSAAGSGSGYRCHSMHTWAEYRENNPSGC